MIRSVEQLQKLLNGIDENPPDVVHFVCWCQENVRPRFAMCGNKMESEDYGVERECDQRCVVCEELVLKPCERCGET